MPIITDIKARMIFNSRGAKTIEVDIISDDKFLGRASSPSGASVGKHEAQSFKENSPEKSLEELNKNLYKFIGIESQDPRPTYDILKNIDNSENYSKIGGSVAYAISLASVESASKALEIPLFKLLKPSGDYKFPYPLGNILGGGSHAGPGTPDIQEYLICPIGASNIIEAIEINIKVHTQLKTILEKLDNNFTYGRGDEGAWAPNLNNDQALEVVEKAVSYSGYDLGKDVALGIDFASSSFWNEKNKSYEYLRQGLVRSPNEQIDFVNNLIDKYHLIYVEDPVHEEDFEGMSIINKNNPECLITGDDMLVTNKNRVKESMKYKSCSGAILKVNQAGSLYDALEFANECSKNHIKLITSHRSGESIDSHISEIAIATSSKMLKTGVIGGERVAKLNQLVRLVEYDLIKGMSDVFTS
ncbi:MAG TPA: enolase [Candidatus Nitrosocosmicus sp.]|jgi:enolase|nr:enolase [Candidatus Nitrosocosmicus sp.]